jgi:hypothetical protein
MALDLMLRMTKKVRNATAMSFLAHGRGFLLNKEK